MIRINLLGVERPKARKLPTFTVQAQQLTIACSVILAASAAGIGWWYWTLRQTAAQVETDITTAQQEQQRLQSVLAEVKQFEARRSQLQQRVQLIEQLRAGQSFSAELLDHVSRSIPDMLWLTDMDQKGDALTIQGRSTTLIAVADLIANLGTSRLIAKPVELVESQVETLQPVPGQSGVELMKFTVRAGLKKAEAGKSPNATAAGGGGGGVAVR
jgi:type IV pilus assembly protein PilN